MSKAQQTARLRLISPIYAPWIVIYGYNNYEFLTKREADAYREAVRNKDSAIEYNDGRILTTNGRLVDRKNFFDAQTPRYKTPNDAEYHLDRKEAQALYMKLATSGTIPDDLKRLT